MKKIISVLLVTIMLFTISSLAFAINNDAYLEEEANAMVRVYCAEPECEGVCTGKFGCNCCPECPGFYDELVNGGVPTNIGEYLPCVYSHYTDITIYEYDENFNVVKDEEGNYVKKHIGDGKEHYYWKAPCCAECTGKAGCKCNNQDYDNPCGCSCCFYQPDHTVDRVQEGLEAGREGFTNGFQSALLAVRNVMYDLFNKLFEFLRVDIILGGKKPSEKV